MSDNLALAYQEQLSVKQKRFESLLAPYSGSRFDLFTSPAKHYRMRAEFRVWHEGEDTFHIMFNKETKEKYRVNNLDAAHESINTAMKMMLEALKGNEVLRKKLYQIDYLCTTSNEMLISLIYHKTLDDAWEREISQLKQNNKQFATLDFIGRSKKQKVVINRDFVEEVLTINNQQYCFKQVENSFTQPNAKINIDMIEWAIEQTNGIKGDLLELYCGAGNFSIPLSSVFNQVVGTEISKSSVSAAQSNIEKNNVNNLTIVRLSSEEFVKAMAKERVFNRLQGMDLDVFEFSTVLVDPPRAGLDSDTLKMISAYDNIIYISCNPDTLAANLDTLTKTHTVERAALFDQFPFTHHIESGVYLKKRTSS
jgi:tRNA (uracil-5-)-methyltransferase